MWWNVWSPCKFPSHQLHTLHHQNIPKHFHMGFWNVFPCEIHVVFEPPLSWFQGFHQLSNLLCEFGSCSATLVGGNSDGGAVRPGFQVVFQFIPKVLRSGLCVDHTKQWKWWKTSWIELSLSDNVVDQLPKTLWFLHQLQTFQAFRRLTEVRFHDALIMLNDSNETHETHRQWETEKHINNQCSKN